MLDLRFIYSDTELYDIHYGISMGKRILIITQLFPPEKTGNASRMDDLSKYLAKEDCEILVVSPFPTFPFKNFKRTWKWREWTETEGRKEVKIFTWQPQSRNPSFISRMAYYLGFSFHGILWSIALRKRYDVILTTAPPIFTGIPGLFAKKLLDKKWIFDVRDLWVDASIGLNFIKKGSLFEKISRKYENLCYGNVDLITATTEIMSQELRRKYTIKSDIAIIPNGVDVDFFKPGKGKKELRIIYSGNLGHAQELDKLILALKKLRKNINAKLIFVGDGDLKDELMSLAEKEGLGYYVEFTGMVPREDVPEYISSSSAGMASLKKIDSLKYALPTKAYEYMSCGIPFVATGWGEIENLARESGAGIMAENDPEDLYKAFLTILGDKEKMIEMGESGRKYVEKNNDRKQISKKLLRNIQKVSP